MNSVPYALFLSNVRLGSGAVREEGGGCILTLRRPYPEGLRTKDRYQSKTSDIRPPCVVGFIPGIMKPGQDFIVSVRLSSLPIEIQRG